LKDLGLSNLNYYRISLYYIKGVSMRLAIFLSITAFFFTECANSSVKSVKIQAKQRQDIKPRVALIIGNSDYKGALSKLSNPINDSRIMRDILTKRGFKIIYRENVGKRDMRKALKEFYKEIRDGKVGLLYFSGHGLELDRQNYIIPIDAKIEEKSDTEYEAISLNKITKRMENANNELNILILDACRNDPFSRAIGTGGLAKIDPPVGLFVSYSTGAGSVASDGKTGGNGLFTRYLVENIQKPLSLQKVFKKTREQVYEASNHKQFPAIYDQTVKGNFFFTKPPKTAKRKSIIEIEDVGGTQSTINITTYPADAKIEIVGLDKKYHKNMKLNNGKYKILISKEGYGTKRLKIDLQSDVNQDIKLTKIASTIATGEDDSSKWNKAIFNGKRSYSFNTANTIKDNYTNLIWTKGDSPKKDWNGAKEYCSSLSIDGYTSWDLPTKRELQYLSDTEKFAPAIDTNYFKVSRDLTHYWTKTAYEADNSEVFGINFLLGGYDNYNKSEQGYIFCVNHKKG
jgi:hypothetical protein